MTEFLSGLTVGILVAWLARPKEQEYTLEDIRSDIIYGIIPLCEESDDYYAPGILSYVRCMLRELAEKIESKMKND
jgi:hypothetical protein